jgi:exoribonuclease-2
MYLLFDEAGKFMAGRVLSESDASAQVELDSGKRVKVKGANQLLRFESPAPAVFMASSAALSQEVELEMAWEFAPDEEFGFTELARDYFSVQATAQQQAAMLFTLFEAPHYFRRAGKGRFRKASADVIAQALAAIDKKKQILAQIDQWAGELMAGQCPQAVRDQLYKILFKPDKNAPEYKAVVEAARASQTAPLALLQKAGAIDSPYQFHWKRFALEHFPKGTGFGPLAAPELAPDLPLAQVAAFSIDDSATTEIDDALSVQGLGSGSVTLGIHIAAPALALQPGSEIDRIARERLSTVYMPGFKITMLPDALVQHFTLQEGRACPAVSLYVDIDEVTLELRGSRTVVEQVPIAHNLRHDQLEHWVTPEWLQGQQAADAPAVLQDLQPQLAFLHRLACVLKERREVLRGKPETFNRPDYNFRLRDVHGDAPMGNETVEISTRQRGAPLDLIVAEAMILANSSWGAWLGELGVPGIYRSQASLAPGVKVRMGTRAAPHAGIGVKCYAWSTSPLRRYTDMVNQWQIIACARHGSTAALAAPFKPKDAQLLAIISGFEDAYSAYNAHQGAMERYWTLQYVTQNGLADLPCTVFKDNMVRADTLPLVLPVLGAQGLPRGARVLVRLGQPDLITLDISGTVVERLDTQPGAAEAGLPDETDDEVGGPIALAIDLADAAQDGVADAPMQVVPTHSPD